MSSLSTTLRRRCVTLTGCVCSIEILALFMLTGIFSTLLITETKQQTLEDISNEDQEGFVKGVVGPEVIA